MVYRAPKGDVVASFANGVADIALHAQPAIQLMSRYFEVDSVGQLFGYVSEALNHAAFHALSHRTEEALRRRR